MRRFNEKKFDLWLKETGKRRTADSVIQYITTPVPEDKKEGAELNLYDLDHEFHNEDFKLVIACGLRDTLNNRGEEGVNVRSTMKGQYTVQQGVALLASLTNSVLFDAEEQDEMRLPNMNGELEARVYISGLQAIRDTIMNIKKLSGSLEGKEKEGVAHANRKA